MVVLWTKIARFLPFGPQRRAKMSSLASLATPGFPPGRTHVNGLDASSDSVNLMLLKTDRTVFGHRDLRRVGNSMARACHRHDRRCAVIPVQSSRLEFEHLSEAP